MEYYVGLDVSLDETAICIVDRDGHIVREDRAASDPDAIKSFLLGTGLTFTRIGLEACPLSQWLYEGLQTAGLPAMCIEVRHVKAALSAMINKTDRNDARGIAQVMRTGWYKAVHVKSRRSHELRFLLGARKTLLNKRLEIESQIRGSLKVFGLKVGSVSRRRFDGRVRELVADLPALEPVVVALLGARAALMQEYDRLHKRVLDVVRDDADCRRMMSIPGVGPISALTFKSAIDNPWRFDRSKAVGPHLGLTPRKYQSGDVDRNGRISKRGDGAVRAVLYEAANIILSRVVRFSPIKAWAMRLAKRSNLKKAKVALARKLAVLMHRIWLEGTTFDWQYGTKTPAR